MKMYPSFVLYKLPNEKSLYLNESEAFQIKEISELKDEHFIIAPFHIQSDWPIYAFDSKKQQEIISADLENFSFNFSDFILQTHHASQEEHQKQVEKIISEISKGKLKKAVLSRVKNVERTEKSLIQIFIDLTQKYSNAFVYLMQLPNGQIWCGASPEILAKHEAGKMETMALAGTQLLGEKKPEEIHWEQKEKDEQIWVQEYVKSVFAKNDTHYCNSEAYTAQAGHLAHIRTDFRAEVNAIKTSQILMELHPTPAVCGTPTPTAKSFLLQMEKHDRIYYSGFLGTYSPEKMQLFVNLRCMRIDAQNYHLYVGGGITADSDPELEFLETENKARTMINVL